MAEAASNTNAAGKFSVFTLGRLYALVLVLVLIWLVSWGVSTEGIKKHLDLVTSEGVEKIGLMDDRTAAGLGWLGGHAPSVAWIDFDDQSVPQNPKGAGTLQSAVTPRDLIAELLKRIRLDSQNRPALVFLDLGPLLAVNPEADQALVAEIGAWNQAKGGPPLAIYAGSACWPTSRGEPGHIFDPGEYAGVAPAPVIHDAQGRLMANPAHRGNVMWSCPMYSGLTQHYWSCVTMPYRVYHAATIGLPSPAWIASVVKAHRQQVGARLAQEVVSAAKYCEAAETGEVRLPGIERPIERLSRVRMTFDPANVDRTKVGGANVVRRLYAGDIIASADSSGEALKDSIVLIGSTRADNLGYDVIDTPLGALPGPIVVAEAMRAAWTFGPPFEARWWTTAAGGSALAILASLTLLGSRRLRAMATTMDGARKGALLVITNPHFVAAVFLPLSLISILLLGLVFRGTDLVRLGAVLFLLEWLFVLDSLVERE